MKAHEIIEAINKMPRKHFINNDVPDILVADIHMAKKYFVKFDDIAEYRVKANEDKIDKYSDPITGFKALEGFNSIPLTFTNQLAWIEIETTNEKKDPLRKDHYIIRKACLLQQNKPEIVIINTFYDVTLYSDWIVGPCRYHICLDETGIIKSSPVTMSSLYLYNDDVADLSTRDMSTLRACLHADVVTIITLEEILEGILKNRYEFKQVVPPKALNKSRERKGKIPLYAYSHICPKKENS